MSKLNRRSFVQKSALATAGAFTLPRFSIGQAGQSANSKINVAMIAAGNVASQSYQGTKGENLVALCDVDTAKFGQYADKFPDINKAKRFTDFRVMLDKMWKDIDMVCISTPDHTHFVSTIASMERGINVFTQKPLTHNIWQARTLKKAKDYYKVHTNMGNQGHTYDGIRQMKEWYDAGVFGQITEAHSFCKGPDWEGKYFARPELPLSKDPIPETLDYDLWLGPNEPVPFHKLYHPLKWRGFNRFGTGTFGDWFCHIADAPVWVLDLYDPVSVEVEKISGGNDTLVPDMVRVRFDFAHRGTKKPCTFYWSNGMEDYMPEKPTDWTGSENLPKAGTIYKGEKANAFTDNRSNNPRLVNREAMIEFKKAGYPEEKYPRVKNGPIRELVEVVKGNIPEAGANFDYATRMTEVMLLGIIACRHGGKIEWDAKNMRITNRPELNVYLKDPVRKGWEAGESLWK